MPLMILTFKLADNSKMQVIGNASSQQALREKAVYFSQKIFNQRIFVLNDKSELLSCEKWKETHQNKMTPGGVTYSIAAIDSNGTMIININAAGVKSAYNNFKFNYGYTPQLAFIYDNGQCPRKKSALSVSKEIMTDRTKTDKLLQQAVMVMSQIPGAKDYAEDIRLLFNMIKDYQNGIYKQVPMNLIIKSLVVLLYFVSPLNLSFEYIPVIGQMDDIALIGWMFKGLHDDLQNYKEWKQKRRVQ